MDFKIKKVFFGVLVVGVLLVLEMIKLSAAKAATDTITLSTDVQTSLAMYLSSNTYTFGNLTAGTPKKGSAGIDVYVTTNASNGYTLSISDGVAGSDSALLHTDNTTRIPDASASIAAPAPWVSGTTKGLGVTVYAADTTKEGKWGTGSTYDDVNNKYAGVPQTADTIHTSAGYKTGADTTSIAFIVDVNPDQKAGSYSGSVTLTATAVLL